MGSTHMARGACLSPQRSHQQLDPKSPPTCRTTGPQVPFQASCLIFWDIPSMLFHNAPSAYPWVSAFLAATGCSRPWCHLSVISWAVVYVSTTNLPLKPMTTACGAVSTPLLPKLTPLVLREAARMLSAALALLCSQAILGFHFSRESHSRTACHPGARPPGMLVTLHAFFCHTHEMGCGSDQDSDSGHLFSPSGRGYNL